MIELEAGVWRILEALGKDSLPGDWIAGAIGLGPYQQKSQ
ncbi:hypothetical protein WCLP8_3420004 [uncultured Gammaproteobacteria bacterium]